MPRPSIVGVNIGVQHETSATNELNAMDGNLPFTDEVEHLGKRHGVDADLLRSGQWPCLRRGGRRGFGGVS